MPDPLLTKELYTAFINTTCELRSPSFSDLDPPFLPPPIFNQAIPTCVAVLDHDEQQNVTQLLIYLLPACNSDTLHRLLEFLSTVTDHANDRQDKDGQEVKPRSFLSNIK